MKLPENSISTQQIKTASKSTPLKIGSSFCEETNRSIEFFLVDNKVKNKPIFTLMAHGFIDGTYFKTSELDSCKQHKVGILAYFDQGLADSSFAYIFEVINKYGHVRGDK